MPLVRHLVQVALVGLASLAICAVAAAYTVSAFDSSFQPLSAVGLTASGNATLIASLVLGAPVVMLYGVPVFVTLARRGKASWLNVLGAAVLPVAFVVVVQPPLALFVVAFALPVAVAVRKLAWVGPRLRSSRLPSTAAELKR